MDRSNHEMERSIGLKRSDSRRTENKMALIAIEGRDLGWNVNFAGRLKMARHGLVERYRRWRQHRRIAAELRRYTDSELVELGISRYDIDEVARGAETPAANS